MAILKTYRCISCGYDVMTDQTGHYALMSGHQYNCRCNVCNEIVSIPGSELVPECPECGASSEHLLNWNPLDGCCPKCGAGMRLDVDASVILAD